MQAPWLGLWAGPLILLLAALTSCAEVGPTGSPPSTTGRAPVLADFAVYAERSITVESDAQVRDGDLGVHRSAPADFGPQLRMGRKSRALQRLIAPSVALSDKAHTGVVETSSLRNDDGRYQAVLPFPAAAMPQLPLAPLAEAPGIDVVLAENQSTTLPPGHYGSLVVGRRAHLKLTDGIYDFVSATVGSMLSGRSP